MTPTSEGKILELLIEVDRNVAGIAADLANRPCVRHEDTIKELTADVQQLKIDGVKSSSNKAFFVMLFAACIPMVPIAFMIMELYAKVNKVVTGD